MAERSLRASQAGIARAEDALMDKGWSRQDLADGVLIEGKKTTTGISIQTIHKFFTGEKVDRKYFVGICKALDLPWNEVEESAKQAKPECPQPKQGKESDICALVQEVRQNTQHNGIPRNLPNSGIRSLEQFFGRWDELETLHQLLQQQERVAIVAIAGMGGVGKTELAIQHALQNLDNYPGGICWLLARGSDIGIQVVEFAKAHFQNFNIPNDLSLMGKVTFCWKHWQPAEGDVLIVLRESWNKWI